MAATEALPDLDSLRLLVLVGDLGSIGAAAGAAGISQPSASKRIRLLEHSLGVALLDRDRQGSRLTDHGRTITDWARAVVGAAHTLVVGARALRSDARSRLATAASQTVAEYLFPHWLATLSHRDRQLSVSLRVLNSAGVIELVRDHAVELGFIESPGVPRDLASRVVAVDRLVVVVGPSHPWARRRRALVMTDLASALLVVREGGSGTRATLERAIGPLPEGHLELDSNAAVKIVVAGGRGAAVLSTLAVAGELADGRLVEVPVDADALDLRRQLRAVWPRGQRLIGAAAEFLAIT